MRLESETGGAAKPMALRTVEGHRPRLLLAEDCEPVRVVTTALLKSMGCDVESAVHGEEAVRIATERQFDLIVLDIEMPIMDGIAAAKSIRRMGGARRGTPLMALSAFLADATQQASWNETFDLALPKPTNKTELHAAINQALSWTPASHMTAPIAVEPVVQDTKVVELRTGLDRTVWAELVDLACADIELSMREIEDLVERRAFSEIKTPAFRLKAIGRTFAAPRLSLAAGRLETAADRREIEVLVDHLRGVIATTLASLAA
jgi:CheY-like chemotaxis protein